MPSRSEASVAIQFRLATEQPLAEMIRLLDTRRHLPEDLKYYISWVSGGSHASPAQIIKWMQESAEAL